MNPLIRVKRVLAQQFNISPREEDGLTPASLIAEYDPDSLDMIEIAMALEEEFLIDFPDEACASLKTVGDIVDFVEKETKGR